MYAPAVEAGVRTRVAPVSESLRPTPIHLELSPPVEREAAGLRAHERRESVDSWRVLLIAFAVSVVLTWPTDFIFFRSTAEVRHAMGVARAICAGSGLAVGLLLPRVAFMRRHGLWFLGLVWLVVCAATSHAMSDLGGPDKLWFNFLDVAVLVPVALSVSLPERVGWTGAFAATLILGYFAPHPVWLQEPYAWSSLVFLLFIATMGVWGGVLLDGLRRRNAFLHRQSLRDAEALAELNRLLNARVDEQTSELRRLTNALDTELEAERVRIARELHDELGQELTALRYKLKVAGIRIAQRPEAAPGELAEMGSLIHRATETVRSIVGELRPKVLDLGLFPAVKLLAHEVQERTGVECRLDLAAAETELAPESAAAAYRVLQESLTNVVRHAAAQGVKVTMREEAGALVVEVADDGAGFQPEHRSSGVGLTGMRERVRHLGGRLEIDSAPGRGTRVRAWLPVRKAEVAP